MTLGWGMLKLLIVTWRFHIAVPNVFMFEKFQTNEIFSIGGKYIVMG